MFVFRPGAQRRGFTLVEVLVSIMILALAMLGISQGQANIARLTIRSEKMGQAIALAESVMTDTELELRRKAFSSMKDEEKGEFKEEGSKEFIWLRTLEKVDLGCFIPKGTSDAAEAQGGLFSLAEKIFENAVRKIKISVQWTEGTQKREVNLTQLYVRFQDLPSN